MSKPPTNGVREPSPAMLALRRVALRAELRAYRKPNIGAANQGRRLSHAERDAIAAKMKAEGKL